MNAPTSSQLPRIAVVQASVHGDIVDQARNGFLETIDDKAIVEEFLLPGAFELPLHARLLADSGRFEAVVAVGFVVDGGVYRHEFVADAVISGLMRVQLDTGVPVFSCVLTPQRFHEHGFVERDDHRQFFLAHMEGKGIEVANACLATLAARRDLVKALAPTA